MPCKVDISSLVCFTNSGVVCYASTICDLKLNLHITNLVEFECVVKKSNEIVLVPFVETTHSDVRSF